ncbi:hypothetical protein Lal_00023731 [Lupinus albus]|uniref:Uncharacterized protein n=1 Tax=Lupinus albus TaxID=3870 RepID=A0A6A5NIS0_LUPAL|nr:hypothetical protein Lalb_Chr13g0294941 [Lupinus albus]KAF1887724.1 hypothetical protein Lal_00023731 [Lupinus albus]
MATTPISHLLFIAITTTTTIFFIISTATATSPPNNKPTVFELLPKYGLPSGLLPSTVTDYTLSEDDGHFVVVLEKPCYVQFDYLVYYDKTVSGKLSYGSITDLNGIEVERLFLWLNVDEIRVDLPPSNSIYFQVGLINKKLSVDQFKTVHSCRDSITSSPCAGTIATLSSEQLAAPVDEIPMLLTE